MKTEKVRIVFLPTPGVGHLISTVEAAKRLLEREPRFSATVLTMRQHVPAWAPAIASYIDSVVSSSSSSGLLDIHFEELPPVEGPPRREDMRGETLVSLLVESTRPHVKAAISRHLSTATPIAAVVMDLFSTTMIDVADELGLPSYVYFTSTAALLGLMLHLPTLDARYPEEMAGVEGEIEFPGFRHPLPKLYMPSFMMDKKNEGYEWVVRHGRRFREARGIITNTFAALEPGPLQALEGGHFLPDHPTPPIYPVGPLLSLEPEAARGGRECIVWLDEQPRASVVFLCFGSMGAFPAEQTREIAVGLERSGYRFLWALRSPSTERLQVRTDADLEEALPEGFLEKTRGRGMVWPSWAPQVEVLAHPATGGFVTHCGWNSCLESLWFGVPMLAWPLYAEQHLNAFQMVREMGVAVGVLCGGGSGRHGLVSAEEVEMGVMRLMGDGEEGRKVRARAEEIKAASRRAVEEGGSSFVSVGQLAAELLRSCPACPSPQLG